MTFAQRVATMVMVVGVVVTLGISLAPIGTVSSGSTGTDWSRYVPGEGWRPNGERACSAPLLEAFRDHPPCHARGITRLQLAGVLGGALAVVGVAGVVIFRAVPTAPGWASRH